MNRQRMMRRKGRSDDIIIYTISVTPATFDPSWAGNTITVDWGDGTPTEAHTTGLSHTYAMAGMKKVKFSCADWTKVTTFDVNTDNCLASIPNFSKLSKLVNWRAYANQLSGTIPSFAACTALVDWSASINQLSGYTAGSFATQKSLATLHLYANLLPQASIDAILADLVTSLGISGRVACSVNLAGTGNAVPSAAGLADKATLAAVSGWVVTTNV